MRKLVAIVLMLAFALAGSHTASLAHQSSIGSRSTAFLAEVHTMQAADCCSDADALSHHGQNGCAIDCHYLAPYETRSFRSFKFHTQPTRFDSLLAILTSSLLKPPISV